MTTLTRTDLHDIHERQRALDPAQSFIVQAPAGSGKTELLTQRFLVLLSHVKQPEEILAITFTKKSAAEMRARIIKALKNASYEPEPEAEHDKKTWLLARSALKRNQSFEWKLLDNPNRLQIQTIDSFNASLTRQLPLLSHFGAPLEIATDAFPLYRQAVQDFLSHLEENFSWVNAIEKLLLHMDNDLANVEKLLINMLAKRDQWLPYIAINVNNPELRKTLESHLCHVITDNLSALRKCFPKEYLEELHQLAQFAGHNLRRDGSDSLITHFTTVIETPGYGIQDKKTWLAFSKLLLTENGSWRKSVNKTQGFPSPSDVKNAEEKNRLNQFKQRIKELLDVLSPNQELQHAFKELNSLPEEYYLDTQWETLDALHDILRVVVAQLKVIFQEQGKIDYIENAQAALTALGSDDAPTDITLALDYKLQHILIDEFQDTSNTQYRLLEKLIAGWQSQDGRTLFVVGDPMQSIYRFREAEVGLFIRARKHGIGYLSLEPLTLSVNFRSSSTIVNWVNEHFIKVFPTYEDITTGAVSYSMSQAKQTDVDNNSVVKLHPFINADENTQADAIVRTIQDSKKHHPKEKIAILVRSRTHLKAILPALKAANLSYRALDIEPLATRPVIQDLLALTRALLHPADRIAWLSILRAPWCGLTLNDLLIIAGNKTKHIILEQLQSADVSNNLSDEGQQHLARVLPILEISISERRRYNLRCWIEHTWLQLGGPACLDQQSDLDDAKAYFNLLENIDCAGDIPNLKELNDAINKLYAAPNNLADDSLQIMTIHNAKGLEFDVVILPHLERKASQDEKQLLQWMERPRENDKSDLILAPIHAVGEETNLVYDYIKRQQNIRNEFETSRLLYVAVTRSKTKLHIFFNLKSKENNILEIKEPVNNSLLHKLWPAIHLHIKQSYTQPIAISETAIDAPISTKQIKRFIQNWTNPLSVNFFSNGLSYHQQKTGFKLPIKKQKIIGIIIHQIFQIISEHSISWWQNQSVTLQNRYIKKHFLQLGINIGDITDAIDIVQRGITNTLNDTRGQWILSLHEEGLSEFPLTAIINNSAKHLVIDKTFIDDKGIRWIIDFKTTDFSGENIDGFLNAEKKLYENQLWEYYLAYRGIEKRPIRVGLYFPLIPAWKEWSFDK